ncbi:MAG: F0F1 ATP synthase subunit A [Rhodospirillales bacterium]|nr:MAG: F0F1 ATP synthase subunit A [Rhodospirillales bacterium]
MANPLDQFVIKTIVPITVGDVDASFTNSSLFMVIAVAAVTVFLTRTVRDRQLVPGRWQSIAELMYQFVGNMVRDNVGSSGKPYFPFIFSLFMFILMGNLLGMIPYSFTFTSHIAVTLGMALMVFIGTTVVAFAKHGVKFFGFFLPHGTPWYIAPVLVPIEVLSYFTRPVSLSLRLFANLTAGHTLLKVFAGFIFAMGLAGVVPLAASVALTGLEFLLAILQAYVFAVLSCIYLHDALHMH